MEKKKIDLLVVGNVEEFKDELLFHITELNITLMMVKSLNQAHRISMKFDFDIIICDLHLDYNYEGYSLKIDQNNYKILCLMTHEIENKTFITKFNKNALHLLIPKNLDEIKYILNEHFLLNYESEPIMVPA